MRSQAVKAGTLLSEKIFAEPPQYGKAPVQIGVPGVTGNEPDNGAAAGAVKYPRVLSGTDGWLYLGGDVSSVCQPEQPVDEVVANLKRMYDAVTASGRRMVIVVPPDKSSAVPEHLPETFAGRDCMVSAKKGFWDEVAATPGLTVIDPKLTLARTQQEWGETVWRKSDTHWGPRGAMAFAQEVVEAIDPAAVADSQITSDGPRSMRGDLSAMIGNPTEDVLKDVTLTRPGVSLTMNGAPIEPDDLPDLGYPPQTVTAESTQAPLVPGKTLVLGDSFFQNSKGKLAPYFESMTYLHNMTADVPGGIRGVVNSMIDSDTVVVEVVERSVVGGEVSIQAPENVDAIVKAMGENPR